MATKTVPGSVVNRRSLFPEGTFSGTIKEIKDDKSPNGNIGSIAFQLVDNELIEGDKDPGKRPHFVRIPVWLEVKGKRGKTEVLLTSEIDAEDDDVPFMLRQAVGQFAQLAACLGQAEVLPDGGVEFADDLEAFIEAFRGDDDGSEFEGEELEFVVEHRRYISKSGPNDGKTMTAVNTDFVIPTEEEEEQEKEEEEPPPRTKKSKPKRSKTKKVEAEPEGDDEGEGEDEPKPKGSGKSKFRRKARK